MTNFSAWDRKATLLVEEAKRDDEELQRQNDAALGLQEGPQGPPTRVAARERTEMSQHSVQRRNFISEQQSKEVTLTHSDAANVVVVAADEVGGRAVRIQNCHDVTIEFGQDVTVVKLLVEQCQRLKLRISCPIITSCLEISHCSDVDLFVDQSIATVQCDECVDGPVRFHFAEPEYVGTFFHQNSPTLEVFVAGNLPGKVGDFGETQVCTRFDGLGACRTETIVRGEKDFPLNIASGKAIAPVDHIPESVISVHDRRAKAMAKREEGNEAFRASDFLQAAVIFTEAIEICSEIHELWANRAQCFLKTGQPEKALGDATRCSELAPQYAKGWFRKGMALHAMSKYAAAIQALCEAEKIDPKNPQVSEAIKMAQLMAKAWAWR